MDVRVDMPVVSRDGITLGTADKIILRPETHDIRGIVLRSGLLRHRDVIVLAEHLHGVRDGGLRLLLPRDAADRLPAFSEADFRRPPASWAPPHGLPKSAVRWAIPKPSYPVAEPAARAAWVAESASAAEAGALNELPRPAGSLAMRIRELVKNPYDADPYDVLLDPGVTATGTPFERGEASTVNPQPRE